MIYDKVGEVIEELFESLFNRYNISLEKPMRCTYYIWLYYFVALKFHIIYLKRSRLYIDSLDCIKNKKKTTINCINNDHKFFQDAATFALNHEKIGKYLQRI